MARKLYSLPITAFNSTTNLVYNEIFLMFAWRNNETFLTYCRKIYEKKSISNAMAIRIGVFHFRFGRTCILGTGGGADDLPADATFEISFVFGFHQRRRLFGPCALLHFLAHGPIMLHACLDSCGNICTNRVSSLHFSICNTGITV